MEIDSFDSIDLHKSVIQLLLYGPRLRIIYSYNGNIGNWGLQHSLKSWKYWKTNFFYVLPSWNYWKFEFSIFLISWKYWKSYAYVLLSFFTKKRRAPKFHAEPTDGWAEISHMRPIQGQKLKLLEVQIYVMCIVYCTFVVNRSIRWIRNNCS